MTELNQLRDEAADFLKRVTDEPEPVSRILDMLDKEISLLKRSLDDNERVSHQLYDMLFLVFELAAVYSVNLDLEWRHGRERKKEKYR